MATAQTAMETARASADAGRRALADAESRARQAARDADQAQQALERLASRKAEMAERLDRVAKECAEAEAEALRLAAETLCTPPRGTYVSFDELCPREVPAVCTCGHAWRLGNDCPRCG